MSEQSRKTNMASEFFTLAQLYRMGLEPLLTLGNKKGVDIYIPRVGREMLSVEVKAVAKRMDWIFGDREFVHAPSKWVVLLCYNGAFESTDSIPDAWIVPSTEVADRLKVAGNGATRYLPRTVVRDLLDEFKDGAGWAKLRAASG